jgi:hypothetical protein
MNIVNGGIIHLVNQDQFIGKDEEHEIELRRFFKGSVLQNIAKNNDFVKKDK